MTLTIVSKKRFLHPEPITVQVSVSAGRPVSGADVSASLTSPTGGVSHIRLREGLLVGTSVPSGGSYAGILTSMEQDGVYHAVVRATDNHGRAARVTMVSHDLPPLPQGGETATSPQALPPFDVQATAVLNVSGYQGQPPLPPLPVRSLSASLCPDRCVTLVWRAPPNVGREGRFEIRRSPRALTTEAAWREASVAHVGDYSVDPNEFQEHRVWDLGPGTHHFAVISVDGQGRRSRVSNDYVVVID